MAMHQSPLAVLEAKDVRHSVRPLRRPIHSIHADLEGLDVGGVGEFGRYDGVTF